MNLNRVILIGNLTRDPDLKTIPSGQSVATFGLATNRTWNDQSGKKQTSTEFHNIVAWRRLAEICGQYLKKGSLIMVEGRLQTRTWQAQDGTNRYRTEVVMENMQMGPRGTGNYSTSNSPTNAPENSNHKNVVVDETPTINLDESGEIVNNNEGNPGEPPSEVMPF